MQKEGKRAHFTSIRYHYWYYKKINKKQDIMKIYMLIYLHVFLKVHISFWLKISKYSQILLNKFK